jgi:hypothetical protein
VQLAWATEPLSGHDLLAVEAGYRQKAGVDRSPSAAVAVRTDHHDSAGATLALGAPFFGPSQAAGAEPFEQGDVPADVTKEAISPIDHELRFGGHSAPSSTPPLVRSPRSGVLTLVRLSMVAEVGN